MHHSRKHVLFGVAAATLAVLLAADRGSRANVSLDTPALSADSFEAVFGAQDPVRGRDRVRDRKKQPPSQGGDGFTTQLFPPPLSPFEP